MFRLSTLFLLLGFLILSQGCGGGDSPTTPTTPTTPTPPTPVATSVTLSASSVTLALGATTQLSATVKDQNGATMAGKAITWGASDAAIVSVSSSGLVTAVSPGTATITAAHLTLSATASVIAQTETQCSDFTPPAGAAPTPAGVTDDGGTFNRRLLLATSPDGLTWTKTNQVLANQGDAQSMIVGPDGTIFVYYLTYHEDYRDLMVAAVSSDNGETWCHKALDFTYVEGVAKGADPAMLSLSDGRFRMYFSGSSDSTGVKTRSAVSSDGISFVQESGVRFPNDNGRPIAPSLIQIGATTHLFWVSGMSNGHATSTDGQTFVDVGTVDLGGGNYIAESGLEFDDGYRMFVFGPPNTDGHELYFAYSADGASWTFEPEPLLPIDDGSSLETNGIRGATAAQLDDGTYLMVYASNIPSL